MQIAKDVINTLVNSQPGDVSIYDMLLERGVTDADLDDALDYIDDNVMMDEDGEWVRVE